MTSRHIVYVLLAIGLICSGSAQVTNVIPEKLFLTDDGHLFWHRWGQRYVEVKKIEEARHSLESLPADQDSDGHWGAPTNGFQLSLRFEKQAFTNGESVVAILIIRNVTNVPVKFFRYSVSDQPSPINVLIFKDGQQLPRKGEGGSTTVASGHEMTIYPQCQCKFEVKLTDYYNLENVGHIMCRAETEFQQKITSRDVEIKVR